MVTTVKSFIGNYCPPSTSKDDFLLELELLMQTVSRNLSDSIIVRGDLNIDLLDNNQYSSNLINLFLYFNCFPTIYTPASALMENASLLDHIFVNAPKILYSGVIAEKFSDHLPVFTIIELPEITAIIDKHIITRSARHISKKGVDLIRQDLAKTNWSFVLESSDIESNYNIFSEKLVNIFDHRLPIQYINTKITRKDSNKWITQSCKSCKQKIKLYKKVLKGTVLMADYLQYCNRLNLIIKCCKADYYLNIIQNNIKNFKVAWNVVNELLGKIVIY